jgi:hypothetical protein
MMMKARCGHVEETFYSDSYHGLCRKCHSNFAFLLELEQKYGEDVLIENWFAKILTYSSSERKEDVGYSFQIVARLHGTRCGAVVVVCELVDCSALL